MDSRSPGPSRLPISVPDPARWRTRIHDSLIMRAGLDPARAGEPRVGSFAGEIGFESSRCLSARILALLSDPGRGDDPATGIGIGILFARNRSLPTTRFRHRPRQPTK